MSRSEARIPSQLAILPLLAAALLAAPEPADAADPAQAGVSAAVRGTIQRANAEHPIGVRIASGEPIYLADRIASGPDSGMQIMLLDQTSFTIGPDSSLVIDTFVYDPASNTGKLTASLGKGVFRFVSGKIARANPSSMTVKLPAATIGIRGTMVFGSVSDSRTVIGLGGPGPENNTRDKAAGVDVITVNGTVALRRPGWGAVVEPGKPPLVLQLPRPTIDGILDKVAPRAVAALPVRAADASAPQPSAPAGAAGRYAGQSGAAALVDLATLKSVEPLAQTTDQVAELAAQTQPSIQTTIAQLLTQSGTGSYTQNNIALSGPAGTGSYDFTMLIDFGTRRIDATLDVTGFFPTPQSASLRTSPLSIAQSYAGQGGAAVFNGAGACVNSSTCQASVALSNAGGIAGTANFSLIVTLGQRSSSGAGTATRQ